VAERRYTRYTIPITCCLDGQAHDVTDESVAAGRETGDYQALCGYVLASASMAAPLGRPCARCTDVLAAHQRTLTTAPVQRGRLWRMLRSRGIAGASARRIP
jgi:hypothetical protein